LVNNKKCQTFCTFDYIDYSKAKQKMNPPPSLPFNCSDIPKNESREWLLAVFGWFLRHFRSAAIESAISSEERQPENMKECLERACNLLVLQELAMLASTGWSLHLKDGTGVRFSLSAELIDEDGNELENLVVNRDTCKFLPEYWEDWVEGNFPWDNEK